MVCYKAGISIGKVFDGKECVGSKVERLCGDPRLKVRLVSAAHDKSQLLNFARDRS